MKKVTRVPKKGQSVGVWLDEDLVVKIDRLAAKGGITRSKLIGNMLEMSVKSLEKADACGVLSVAILLRDWEENLRAWVRLIRDEGHLIKEDYETGMIEEESWESL